MEGTPEGMPEGTPEGIAVGTPEGRVLVWVMATTWVDKAELRAGQSVMEAAQLVTVWMLVE